MWSKTDRPRATRLRHKLSAIAPKLVRDLAVLAGGQFASKLIGLVAFALLARRLDPAGYGAVEYVAAATAFFAMAVDCGLGTIAVRRIAASHAELPALAAEVPAARLAIALVAMPMVVVSVALLGPSGIPTELVLLYAASLVFAACNQDWLLQGTERMTQVAVGQTLRMALFALAVLFLVGGPADLVAAGWAEAAAAAAMCAFYLGVQAKAIAPVRLAFPAARLLALVREGAPLGLSQFVWFAAQYMPLLLVGSLAGGAEVGLFASAQRLVTSLSTFSYVYHFNLYPALARASARSRGALAELLRASFRVTAWAATGFALAITLTASPILTLIYGERFSAATPMLAILVWTIPITFLSGHARWSLVVTEAQRGVLYAQVSGLAAVVAAGFPLIYWLGAPGVSLAAVVGALAVWVVSHRLALRQHVQLPPLSSAAAPVLLAAALVVAAPYTGLGAWTSALAATAVFGGLAPLIDRSLIPDLVRLAQAKASSAPAKAA